MKVNKNKWTLVSEQLPPTNVPVLLQDKWAGGLDELYIGKFNESKYFVALSSNNLAAVGGWNGAYIESDVYQEDVYCWMFLPEILETK